MLCRQTHRLHRHPSGIADCRSCRHVKSSSKIGHSARLVQRRAAADAVGTQDLLEDMRVFVADELPRIFVTGVWRVLSRFTLHDHITERVVVRLGVDQELLC
jgi:hypothetical protein